VKPKLMPLFHIARGKLTHLRVTEDLAKYKSTSGKRKVAGKAGGLASAGKHSENGQAIAGRLPTKSEPESEPKEERSNDLFVATAAPKPTEVSNSPGYPDLFERAWSAYPHVKGRSSKKLTHGFWKKLPAMTREALPAAVVRYAKDGREPKMDCGAPAMDRWVRDEKFADWLGGASAGPMGVDWPDSRWAIAVDLWRTASDWDASLGPTPGQPGCRVPSHLLIQPTAAESAA
jgi:hypothetical protein